MPRRTPIAGATALLIVLAIGFFPGCSSDECPTCPEPATSVGLSSEVMLPSPAPFNFQDLWIAGPEDVVRPHLYILGPDSKGLTGQQFEN